MRYTPGRNHHFSFEEVFAMRWKSIAGIPALAVLAVTVIGASGAALAQSSNTILKPADTQKLLPAAVYYKGQSAPTQLRNTGGVKFSDGQYVLSTLVDNSGYSSD